MPNSYGDDLAVMQTLETYGVDINARSGKLEVFSIQENTLTSEESFDGFGLSEKFQTFYHIERSFEFTSYSTIKSIVF